jgi:hypothetical protein
MSPRVSETRPALLTVLAAALVALFAARLAMSVTVSPIAAPVTAAAGAPASGITSAVAAAPVAAPVPALPTSPGMPVAPAAPARPQETRYYVEGRYLVHEITGSVPAEAARVRVDTHLGAVRLTPALGRDLGYRILIRASGPDNAETRRRLARMVVGASRAGDLLQFTGALPDVPDASRGLGAEFELAIPPSVRGVDVGTGAGDIEADGIPGAVTLITRGGTIVTRDLAGPLSAETRGGRIEVGVVRDAARLVSAGGDVVVGATGGALTVRTSGGDVRIGQAGGDVRVETGGGSVSIDKAGAGVRVATSGGDIEVGEAKGEVSVATAGGGIRVGDAGAGVRCETAAGPIVLDGVGGAVRAISSAGNIRALVGPHGVAGDTDIQTWRGDVTLSLPEGLPVTVRALVDNPVGQPIQSDFPISITHEMEGAGRPMVIGEARVGGGGPVLKLRTLNGRILILKVKNDTTQQGPAVSH